MTDFDLLNHIDRKACAFTRQQEKNHSVWVRSSASEFEFKMNIKKGFFL